MAQLPPRMTQADLDALPQEQARILIAQDVLDILGHPAVLITEGEYCRIHFPVPPAQTGEVELREAFGDIDVCEVCAKGALLLAHALRFDAVKLNLFQVGNHGWTWQFNSNANASTPLTSYFRRTQLDLIESAFERSNFYGWSEADEAEAAPAFTFGRRYEDPVERLRAIMENVVRHGGTFDPRADLTEEEIAALPKPATTPTTCNHYRRY